MKCPVNARRICLSSAISCFDPVVRPLEFKPLRLLSLLKPHTKIYKPGPICGDLHGMLCYFPLHGLRE